MTLQPGKVKNQLNSFVCGMKMRLCWLRYDRCWVFKIFVGVGSKGQPIWTSFFPSWSQSVPFVLCGLALVLFGWREGGAGGRRDGPGRLINTKRPRHVFLAFVNVELYISCAFCFICSFKRFLSIAIQFTPFESVLGSHSGIFFHCK